MPCIVIIIFLSNLFVSNVVPRLSLKSIPFLYNFPNYVHQQFWILGQENMEKKVVKYVIKPWRCVYEWIPCPCKMVQMCILLILQMSKRGCILKGVAITNEFKKIVA
jgi:hypothetical protein